MHSRIARRSLALAMAAAVLVTGVAFADAVRADGDQVSAGSQTAVDLGEVRPGAVITVPVSFELICSGDSHPDPGQVVTMTLSASGRPTGGAVVSVTPGTVGPVPDTWVPDGDGCPFPAPSLTGGTPSMVTLRAPTAPNVGYTYTIGYARGVAPAGSDDANALRGTTTVSFTLAVVTNTAPILTLPDDQSHEGDTAGGWALDLSGVGAADAEDEPDPMPTCSPTAGVVLPLGSTTVSCRVTDSGGRTDDGSFVVTVVDTTPPTLAGMPSDQSLVTEDAAGATISFAPPTAVDLVDTSPTVACVPASGSMVPIGTTTVTCTATDASSNVASDSFQVDVVHDAPEEDPPGEEDPPAEEEPGALGVNWDEPVGDSPTFTANRGRTIPVKAALTVDRVSQVEGTAELRVTPCDGGAPAVIPMTFRGGRWKALLDTSDLAGPCHIVAAWFEEHEAGSFRLELTGHDPVTAAAKAEAREKARAEAKAERQRAKAERQRAKAQAKERREERRAERKAKQAERKAKQAERKDRKAKDRP